MHEITVEIKQCKHCSTSFEITDKDLEFYEKVSPIFSGQKYLIPTPTLCPDCRQQRRLSFRNERSLYKRKCDFSGKDIISIYSPDKPYKVYDNDIWWSDKTNNLDYGKEFDFQFGAMEQFNNLIINVPFQKAFITTTNVNSDYGNHTGDMKDCYLCFASWGSESIYYGTRTTNSKDSLDLLWAEQLYNCYECIGCINCNKCFYSKNCSNSHGLLSCVDCIGCSDCILCSNLNSKKYCIENKQYTRDEYNKKKSNFYKKIFREGWKFLKEIELKMIHKNLDIINSQNCIGDNINNCKDSFYVFDVSDVEDCKYSTLSTDSSYTVYDATGFGAKLEKGYELVDVGLNSFLNCFCSVCHSCTNIFYCFNCYNSNDLFLCVGLRNKSYCILNKQYTKEEYEIFVPKIIEHMMKTGELGEFFPSSISPFGYNETVAMEYFPINNPPIPNPFSLGGKDAGKADRGIFNRSTYKQPQSNVEKIIPASKLPDNITDIPDDILNWAIECEITKKPFRIIKPELEFYRKHNLPIPKRHPDQRHLDRIKLRNPRKLYDRKCGKCGIDIKTTYPPERTEIVYCEECYNKEIY